MAWPFGHPLTFRELLYRLESQCKCTVQLQDAGGIPDRQSGGVSGKLYDVERIKNDELRCAFVEIFHMDVTVLPDHLRSICNQLGLDETELNDRLH